VENLNGFCLSASAKQEFWGLMEAEDKEAEKKNE
jgi:hypothetical protein